MAEEKEKEKEKHNRKNPAVKRILQEVKEMQHNPSDDFIALPLEDNIFEWQFAIRGPSDTEFERGIYHGRIQLPSDYPFQPPSFMLLTPNGRFETQTKICLSISDYHPEHWQPSWSVRTALVALIAFMPTDPSGALGSLNFSKEERLSLAIKSQEAAPKFGSPERQMLIDEIHQKMVSKAPPVRLVDFSKTPVEQSINRESEVPELPHENADARAHQEHAANPNVNNDTLEDDEDDELLGNAGLRFSFTAELRISQPATNDLGEHFSGNESTSAGHFGHRLYTLAAIGLTVAIVFLLLKKLLKASGYGAYIEDGL